MDGLLFGSGLISTSSIYSSGNLVPFYLSSVPNMYLREETTDLETYEKGLVSVTIHTQITGPWNFYLEATNDVISGVSFYISYIASGHYTNAYGFYKELLELHAGASDIYHDRTPGYIWARSACGNYITGRLPLYFKRLV